VLGRSRNRDRGRGAGVGGINLLNSATIYLGGVAPYHWLDFINNRALYAGADVGDVTQATGYSFTRASDGYYQNADGTLTNFASGALRRGDRGVLIEGARTNLMLHSQDFTQAVWALDNSGAVNPIVTANYGLAPDGTMTADRIQLNKTGGTFSRIAQTLTGLTSGSYTISVWMRTISGTANVGLRNDSTGINCVVTTTWQRFSVTIGPATVAGVQILLFDSIPGNDETADILAWVGQLEAGAFPSSPIVTVAAAATRAADVLTYTVNTTAQIQAAVAGQPELVTNGDFSGGTTGWQFTRATGSVSSGSLLVTATAAFANAYQTVTTVAGKTYRLSVSGVSTTGAKQVSIYAGTALGTGDLGNASLTPTPSSVVFLFRATSASTVIFAQDLGAFVSGDTFSIDNISVKEVPANSLTLYPLSLWAEFERAVDTGAETVLFQVDDGTGVSESSRILITSADEIYGQVVDGGSETGVSQVTGALSVGVRYKAALRSATNSVRAAQGGTLGGSDTSVVLPNTPTIMRVGTAGASPNAFAYFSRLAVFNSALTDAQLQTVST